VRARAADRHPAHHAQQLDPRAHRSQPTPIAQPQYAYLLGIYLGDGWLCRMPRTWRLFVFQDAAHPGVIEEIATALPAVVPGIRVHVRRRGQTNCVAISAYSRSWPALFPQHGPGRKHERRIALEPWQQEIVADDPRPLVRGLIHSDGCRFVANQTCRGRAYSYVRYMFSNRSGDILAIHCDALDRLGIGWNLRTSTRSRSRANGTVAALRRSWGSSVRGP
jgi:hypothetical protein